MPSGRPTDLSDDAPDFDAMYKELWDRVMDDMNTSFEARDAVDILDGWRKHRIEANDARHV